jgi:hypothetical protein
VVSLSLPSNQPQHLIPLTLFNPASQAFPGDDKKMPLRIVGLLLLLAGWLLLPAAIILLPALAARTAFVLAGMGVEVLGFVFLARTHIPPRKAHRDA